MQAYILQLLEDIRASYRPEGPEGDAAPLMPWETSEELAIEQMEEYFAEVERFIHEDPPHNLSYYCGLVPEQFPLAEGLNDEQVAALVGAYVEMLRSWNIDTDIPSGFPYRRAYALLISLLNEHFHISRWGRTTHTFCNCEPTECVYGEHCICKDYE